MKLTIKSKAAPKKLLPNKTKAFRASVHDYSPMQVFRVTLMNHEEVFLMKVGKNFFMHITEQVLYKYIGSGEVLGHSGKPDLAVSLYEAVEAEIIV